MITNTPSTHRGENARVQLLCSAADVYGELGLDGATTRKIAQVSGQNIAAISYYFGSKEGLYLAVAQLIANTIKENFSETTAEIDTYLRQTNPPPDEAIKLLQKALVGYNYFQLEKKNLSFSRILAREQLNPTEAYTIIHEQALGPIYTKLNRLIAIYIGSDPNSLTTLIQTHAILGETLSFRIARETLLRQTGWKHINEEEYKIINQVLIEHTNILLEGLRHRKEAQK
ncbi:TPA: transcriptional regulator CecR [Providencia stuartii]|uniref:Transcriptional regulator CecR n=2 Tax=Providencia stuartii TaxID=588 RepID=A0AAJ1JEY1_PROST|nr:MULTISPECIES: transcriptional regulator CecR [Providencia]EDU58434.1 transcriptional regulator, TetR family [Providencia stuartii ATCC 25827]SST02345.1 TetR family transcriptional regulator [Acinetobacter baumannii]AIN65016.1 bacterial regulatory s, tetR family protein [Providencia stuartii]AMG66792.1 transcriptional regulator [Providencia stuartii]AVE42671.1 transcriptional regulator [Providencia stuartii]